MRPSLHAPRIANMLLRLLLIPIVLLLAAGGLYACSPPRSLDVLSSLFPGDTGTHRVASAVRFAPGKRGTLDVWAPTRPSATPRPVLIFFYGGGWNSGWRRDYSFVAKAYAARGFVVVMPDYRVGPDFVFPAFNQDGAAAIKWTRDHIAALGGDPNRIVLGGHSAGAYIAVMLALDPHYLADIGVDPHIVRAAAGLAGPYDFYPWDSPLSVAAMSRWPDPQATQPIHFARADAPPLFLGAGTADKVVRLRNARNLAAREQALGNRTTILREYPDASHNDLVMALSKPFRARQPVLDETIAFFDKALARR